MVYIENRRIDLRLRTIMLMKFLKEEMNVSSYTALIEEMALTLEHDGYFTLPFDIKQQIQNKELKGGDDGNKN